MKRASATLLMGTLLACASGSDGSRLEWVSTGPDYEQPVAIEPRVVLRCPRGVTVELVDLEPIHLADREPGFEVDRIDAFGREFMLPDSTPGSGQRLFHNVFSVRCEVGGKRKHVQFSLRSGLDEDWDLTLVDLQPDGIRTLDGAEHRMEDFD